MHANPTLLRTDDIARLLFLSELDLGHDLEGAHDNYVCELLRIAGQILAEPEGSRRDDFRVALFRRAAQNLCAAEEPRIAEALEKLA